MIRSFLFFLLIVFTGPLSSNAEPIIGPSYLGMCSDNFPCAKALSVFSGQPLHRIKATGYLASTFGNRCSCVKNFLNLEGAKYLRVHIANGTCFRERGRVCQNQDVFVGRSIERAERELQGRNRRLLNRYRAVLRKQRNILQPYLDAGNLDLRISFCLECPFYKSARRVLRSVTQRYIPEGPRVKYVDSVLRQDCLDRQTICERHGKAPMFRSEEEACIVDTDGESVFELDWSKLETSASKCEALFVWSHGFNLLSLDGPKVFVAPRIRTKAAEDFEFDIVKEFMERDVLRIF